MMSKKTTLLLLLILFIVMGITVCQSPGKKPRDVTKNVKPDPESLYQTRGKWDNQYGDTLELSKLSGKIPIISMVFTRCTFACPRIVEDMQTIEAKLPPDKKSKVVFVLISFDSDRDHTTALKDFTKHMKLTKNWIVLHGGKEDVLELSMLLNVKYKKILNGDFTHSSGISMLDTKGILVRQSEGLGKDPQEFIHAITRL